MWMAKDASTHDKNTCRESSPTMYVKSFVALRYSSTRRSLPWSEPVGFAMGRHSTPTAKSRSGLARREMCSSLATVLWNQSAGPVARGFAFGLVRSIASVHGVGWLFLIVRPLSSMTLFMWKGVVDSSAVPLSKYLMLTPRPHLMVSPGSDSRFCQEYW